MTPNATRPDAPVHLTPAAAEVWKRTIAAMPVWRDAFAETLGLYCELRAAFDADPTSFSPTRLVTLRLLSRDLGCSPGTIDLAR